MMGYFKVGYVLSSYLFALMISGSLNVSDFYNEQDEIDSLYKEATKIISFFEGDVSASVSNQQKFMVIVMEQKAKLINDFTRRINMTYEKSDLRGMRLISKDLEEMVTGLSKNKREKFDSFMQRH